MNAEFPSDKWSDDPTHVISGDNFFCQGRTVQFKDKRTDLLFPVMGTTRYDPYRLPVGLEAEPRQVPGTYYSDVVNDMIQWKSIIAPYKPTANVPLRLVN